MRLIRHDALNSHHLHNTDDIVVTSGAQAELGRALGGYVNLVNGEFIERNAGTGSDFVSLNVRVSRVFWLNGRVQIEALAEAFNLTNHRNVLARNTNFGAGAYPTNPSPTFNQITAVGEPRSFQFGIRMRF